MKIKTTLFTITLLALFIGSSLLAIRVAKKIIKPSIHVNSPNSPDFFMTNATYVQFNNEGQIRNQVHAAKITHLADNNMFFFDSPNIIMNNQNEEPWHITANKGKSEKGKDTVYLWENVKIIQKLGTNNPAYDITTTAMTIYPHLKIANTAQPVTIIQNQNITKARGAEVDFNTSIIKLHSQFEGLYQIK